MCEPTTILMATSAVMAAAGAVGSGISSHKQSKYQAEVMENQAKMEEARAVQSLEQNEAEIAKFDRQSARLRGEQNALMGASGLDMSSGSLMDIAADTVREQAIDRQNLAHQGKINAQDHVNQAGALRSQASLERSAGRNSLLGGIVSGSASLLGGAAGVAGGFGGGLDKVAKAGKSGGSLLGGSMPRKGW